MATRHAAILCLLLGLAVPVTADPQPAQPTDPQGWPKIATVDTRFVSFNVEMAEVTGGDFWAPYGDPQKRRLAPRNPLNLNDPRLLAMARGLSPAIVRVSGTWANSTYVPA